MKSTHCMALGPGGAYVFSYRSKYNVDHLSKPPTPSTSLNYVLNNCLASSNIPDGLRIWLYATNSSGQGLRSFPTLRVSLGPDGKAFYASDGQNHIWSNLPTGLVDALQDRIANGVFTIPPRIVTLGLNDNFILITQSHGAAWVLTEYPAIRVQMDKIGAKGSIDNITVWTTFS